MPHTPHSCIRQLPASSKVQVISLKCAGRGGSSRPRLEALKLELITKSACSILLKQAVLWRRDELGYTRAKVPHVCTVPIYEPK